MVPWRKFAVQGEVAFMVSNPTAATTASSFAGVSGRPRKSARRWICSCRPCLRASMARPEDESGPLASSNSLSNEKSCRNCLGNHREGSRPAIQDRARCRANHPLLRRDGNEGSRAHPSSCAQGSQGGQHHPPSRGPSGGTVAARAWRTTVGISESPDSPRWSYQRIPGVTSPSRRPPQG